MMVCDELVIFFPPLICNFTNEYARVLLESSY